MQDRGYELPRIPIPRTPVNKLLGGGLFVKGPAAQRLDQLTAPGHDCGYESGAIRSFELL
jgi:hypothetical protein